VEAETEWPGGKVSGQIGTVRCNTAEMRRAAYGDTLGRPATEDDQRREHKSGWAAACSDLASPSEGGHPLMNFVTFDEQSCACKLFRAATSDNFV
jgi:hypothetical protein